MELILAILRAAPIGYLTWPFSDQVLIGYDNADGRAALRACSSVVLFARQRGIPVQVRFG